MPYDGPYRVISRNEKTFVIDMKKKEIRVTIDRLKPVYIIVYDFSDEDISRKYQTPTPNTVRKEDQRTHFGRRVRFPDRLQIGFSKIEKETFIKLKIFYPRIYHISYDDYILDIELKYGKEADESRGVINAMKLSSDEFTFFKIIFPRLADINFELYQKRMISAEIYVNFPLPADNYKQHVSKMDYLDIDPIPYDVFCFLKKLYPDLSGQKYSYTVLNGKDMMRKTYEESSIQILNVITKHGGSCRGKDRIITLNMFFNNSAHVRKTNQVVHMNHKMIDCEFEQFMKHIPEVFESYFDWKMRKNLTYSSADADKETFLSFKKGISTAVTRYTSSFFCR
ncbi:hypothetical protein QTP88_006242 [Uroleucon formosanum]